VRFVLVTLLPEDNYNLPITNHVFHYLLLQTEKRCHNVNDGKEASNKSKDDFYECLAPSVHHLQTTVLNTMQENGYNMDS
jgi:hypothetical protein